MSIISRIPIIGRMLEPNRTPARSYHGIDSVRRRAGILHAPARALFRTIALTQHTEIETIGLENVPPDGCVFLVGNHPNSFLDYFNLITVIRHPVGTAAKDTITSLPIIGGILKNHMMMIPVSRVQDKAETGATDEERLAANEKMMRDAVEQLVHGRLFNIYAEGRSTDSRSLNRIKLGFIALAMQAEREFNYRLNLRIVPYGYYYDRINKFQSSVCVIFGRPFKIRHLVEMPEDFLSLSAREQSALEKKIMIAGKQRLQGEIEKLIINIPDRTLVSLIDDITALYVLTPIKYMGPYQNVREKYILNKLVAETIQAAHKDEDGRKRLAELRRLLSEYRGALSAARVSDAVVRREFTAASVGYHLRALLEGVLFLPLTLYGYLANYLPRLAGRLMRYWVIDVRKRAKVDGDEQAIVAAFTTGLITYPILGTLIYFLLRAFAPWVAALPDEVPAASIRLWVGAHPGWFAGTAMILAIYLMGRLWRFSLRYGARLRQALMFLWDGMLRIFGGERMRRLREKRHEVLDAVDFLIGDFQ